MGVLGVLGVYVLYNYLQLMGGATVISNEDYPKVIMTIDLEMGLDWVGGWVGGWVDWVGGWVHPKRLPMYNEEISKESHLSYTVSVFGWVQLKLCIR